MITCNFIKERGYVHSMVTFCLHLFSVCRAKREVRTPGLLKTCDISKQLLKQRTQLQTRVEYAMEEFNNSGRDSSASRSALEELLVESYLFRREEIACFIEKPDEQKYRGKTFFSKYQGFKDNRLVRPIERRNQTRAYVLIA
jgi:hypothetical protein